MPSRGSVLDDHMFERELSPESRKFAAPPPPRGTRRRPPKGSDLPGNLEVAKNFVPSKMAPAPASSVEESKYAMCAEHIEALNPKDNQAPLQDLTKDWLLTPDAPLPVSADSRIYIFMHHNNAYDVEATDVKTVHLVRQLTKGTEIEEREPHQYQMLEPRVLDRFRLLSINLFHKNFIENINGTWQKTKAFLECWKNKESYWKGFSFLDDTKSKPEIGDVYDIEGINDDDISPVMAPPKRQPFSRSPRNPILYKTAQSSSLPSRRNPDDLISGNRGPYSAKRPKTSSNSVISDKITAPSSTENIPSGSLSVYTDEIQADDAEDIRYALDFLSSPTIEIKQTTPQSRNPLNQPITPTSPTPTMGTLANEDRSSTPTSLIIKLPTQSPNAEHSLPTTLTTSSRNPEICLNFQSPAGNYNLNRSVPASCLRASSLSAFFELFSERSGVSIDSLNCLTFRYSFVGKDVEVIQRDSSQDEWEGLKNHMRRRLRFSRERDPRRKEFDIWVDAGDTRNVMEREEDLGGL